MEVNKKPNMYHLKDILNRKGITQHELSKMTNINYSNLNAKINGKMTLSFAEAIKICGALNIRFSDLSGDYVTNSKRRIAQ